MKLIEVNADAGNIDTVSSIAETNEAADFRLGYKGEDGRQIMRILIADDRAQAVLDTLQKALGNDSDVRIVVIGVEATLHGRRRSNAPRRNPRPRSAKRSTKTSKKAPAWTLISSSSSSSPPLSRPSA